jgi:hypothetical protein
MPVQANDLYDVYVMPNTKTKSRKIVKNAAPDLAGFYGTVVHPTVGGKPIFTATTVLGHGLGEHQIYLTRQHDRVPLCYVNVKVQNYSKMRLDVPVEIVAKATNLSRDEVESKNPLIMLISWTETVRPLAKQFLASNLLPVLVHYGQSHRSQALLSNNLNGSGRYARFFGKEEVKSDPDAGTFWIGITL